MLDNMNSSNPNYNILRYIDNEIPFMTSDIFERKLELFDEKYKIYFLKFKSVFCRSMVKNFRSGLGTGTKIRLKSGSIIE